MELLGLRYFCYAAGCQSFSRTAEHFMVPTSNISQVIKRIEGEVGARLFERRGNRIELNDKGRAFYLEINRALQIIDAAKREITASNEIGGEIKLLALTNRRAVADIIKEFGEKHPAVTFYLSNRADGAMGDYDIIISDTLPHPNGFTKELFTREKMLLAVRDDMLPEKDNVLPPELLSGLRFVTMLEASSLYRTTAEIFKSLGISPAIAVKCDDPAIVRQYVELGLGAAIYPERSWRGVFSEKIVTRDIGEFYRNTFAYVREGALESKRISLFVEEMKQYMTDA